MHDNFITGINYNWNLRYIVLVVGGALSLGLSIAVFNSSAAGLVASIPLILLLFIKYKFFALYLFILFIPFSLAPIFNTQLLGLQGMRVANFMAAFALFSFVFHQGINRLHNLTQLEKKIYFYLFIYFLIFTISILRSLEYFPRINMFQDNAFHNLPIRYLLAKYVRPCLYFLSFIYVIVHVEDQTDIQKIFNILCLSCFILSLAVVVMILMNFNLLSEGRQILKEEVFQPFFGMHYIAIASFYLILYPLVLCKAIYGNWMDRINLVSSSIAIVFVQSRSAIGAICIAIILFLFLCGEKKKLIWFFVAMLCLLIFWTPSFLIKTLATGLEEGSFNAVTTNRLDVLWAPLIKEWVDDVYLLLFGKGAYGIVTSKTYWWTALNAHSAYINFFLNCGAILFVLLILFLIKYLWLSWKIGKKINTPIFWAFFVSFISYLIGALTNRYFMPAIDNAFLFPIVALTIKYVESTDRALTEEKVS